MVSLAMVRDLTEHTLIGCSRAFLVQVPPTLAALTMVRERRVQPNLAVWVQTPYWLLSGRTSSMDFEARPRAHPHDI